ncbi:alpha/beta hydrolase [Paenibacillus stellifer]|uniref:alpha/beta hydrolase n=1 Tax=Paenibacillus stellifer TaxID=169760 RepID=UPI00068A7A49|nr:alpha/beta fold hydrolase [Paenibacillus stellifer]
MEHCLFIHGFTGGIFEISPLAEYAERRGLKAHTFTLGGHTGRRSDLARFGRAEWLRQAEGELTELAKAAAAGVHVIGFSMGALLACHLANRYREMVKSLTLLAAPVFPLNPGEIVRTLGKPAMLKNYFRKFGSTPLRANREFNLLVRESFTVYPGISAPALIVQGTRDHLVKTRSASYLQQHLGSPRSEVLMVEGSGHLLCYSEEKDKVLSEVLRFISMEKNTGME